MNILLDYAFKVSSITPTPAASTGFLKDVCVVVKPLNGGVTTGVITECASASEVAALTANTESSQLFAAGMSKVFILPMDDLDLADALEGHESDFYTVLISSDFDDEDIQGVTGVPAESEVKSTVKIQDITYTSKLTGDSGDEITVIYTDTKSDGSAEATLGEGTYDITVAIEDGVTPASVIKTAIEAAGSVAAIVGVVVDTGDESDVQSSFTPHVHLAGGNDAVVGTVVDAIDVGLFTGVIGVQSQDEAIAKAYAAIENRAGFYAVVGQKAKNMFYAFGKLLSNALNWNNQQYVTMPVSDLVATLGECETMFDDRVSFVMSDSQYGNRLALFACGGKAIVAPYITKNLSIDMQSAALSFISGNQPAYTKKNAALLENELKDVIQLYIDRNWIEAGTVAVTLEEDNFVASGAINISEPKALWRVFAEMRQTL
jgi:hypothetical protein